MTTAMIISELISLHDDELVADIDATFDQIDREVAAARDHAQERLLLDVEWLVDELVGARRGEALEISLELTETEEELSAEVAKVA